MPRCCLLVAVVFAATGCAEFPVKFLQGMTDRYAKIYVPSGQTLVQAHVRDEVTLEIGPTLEESARKEFRVTINGRNAAPAGWGESELMLIYRFRPLHSGTFRIEVLTRYPNVPEQTLVWDLTVTE